MEQFRARAVVRTPATLNTEIRVDLEGNGTVLWRRHVGWVPRAKLLAGTSGAMAVTISGLPMKCIVVG